MPPLKGFFFSGEVAAAIGVAPVTLRMWRDRGYCDLGSIDEGEEGNPRARRRYQIIDACRMAVASTFNRHGYSMEEAFNIAIDSRETVEAVAAVIAGIDRPDLILTVVGASHGDEGGDGWANPTAMDADMWKKHIAAAFEARDAVATMSAECVFAINVSAIARRVQARLLAGASSDEA